MHQLNTKLLGLHRKVKATQQKYQCPVCKGPLGTTGKLDHCHRNGQCRSMLCSSCNEGEGKVLAGMLFRTPKSNLAYKDRVAWLENLVKYWDYWDNKPSGIFHPTFDMKTGKQKPVKRKVRKKA